MLGFHAQADDTGHPVQVGLREQDGEHLVELRIVTYPDGTGLLGLHHAVLVEQRHLGVEKLCDEKKIGFFQK